MDGAIVPGTKNRVMRPEYVKCDGVFNVPIYNGRNDIIGRALLTCHIKLPENGNGVQRAVVLTDIYIYHEEDRRQGAADDLMGCLTEMFDTIMTGESTSAGKRLCLKHGFKIEVHNAEKYLVYRKEKEDDRSRVPENEKR
jgi:hypothetical protein